jgi:hypothetical protein
MRCTQIVGFGSNNPINEEELSYLHKKEYSSDGMFDEIPLHEYYFNETPLYREIVQASPWSSGPMLHFAYKRNDGVLFNFWKKEK